MISNRRRMLMVMQESDIPAGYEELEYLIANGNQKFRIDGTFNFNETILDMTIGPVYPAIITVTFHEYLKLSCSSYNDFCRIYYPPGSYWTFHCTPYTGTYRFELNPDTRIASVIHHNEKINSPTYDRPHSFYVGEINIIDHYNGNSQSIHYPFSFKKNSSDELHVVKSVIRKSDGEAMFYDTTSKTFMPNTGTGKFGYKKLDGTVVEPT